MKFIAQVTNSKPDFKSEYNQRRFQHFLNENEGAWIEIEPVQKTRSKRQNRYYWGALVPAFAEFHLISEDDAHELLKQEFNFKFVKASGKNVKIGKSTASLRVGEFVEYCMRIEQYCNENGIYIPSKEDYYKTI